MKLRNKKTGEINCGDLHLDEFDSLEQLNEEWEDYKEPKGSALDLMILTLTNFIENEPDEDKVDLEECKQMLGKLKAWKRLKDKGFKFIDWNASLGEVYFEVPNSFFPVDGCITIETRHDLDLLFGDKE